MRATIKRTQLVDVPEYLSKSVSAGVLATVARGAQLATPAAPADTGALRKSITYGSEGNRGNYGSNLIYAAAIEYGGPPRTPPLDAIKEWARRVLGDESAAGAVWTAIRRRGNRPQPFMRPSIPKLTRDIPALFRAAFERLARGR